VEPSGRALRGIEFEVVIVKILVTEQSQGFLDAGRGRRGIVLGLNGQGCQKHCKERD
jgi:hypothetical protein